MSKGPKFPVLAVIVLLAAVAWLLSELGVFNTKVPWLPIILIVIAIGWISNRYR